MNSEYGNIIRDSRRKQKMTLRDLAKKTGIDYSMISKYENGLVNPPRKKLQLILSALNITEDTLLSEENVLNMDLAVRRRSTFTRVNEDQLTVSTSIAERVVIEEANGRCELCGQVFPDGELFLESHYVVWLRDGGTPTPDNTVALCPNCHKRIHIYNDPADISKLLKIAKSHK